MKNRSSCWAKPQFWKTSKYPVGTSGNPRTILAHNFFLPMTQSVSYLQEPITSSGRQSAFSGLHGYIGLSGSRAHFTVVYTEESHMAWFLHWAMES